MKRKKSFTPVKSPLRGVRHRRDLTGFTLIELLVVIAVIGIITTIIVVSVRSGQSRARDAKRATDLEALNTAIQMYYRATGHFPSLPENCGDYTKFPDGQYTWAADRHPSSNQVSRWASGACLTADFIPGLVPKYISALPTDPGPQIGQQNYRGFLYYHFYDPGSKLECYKIVAHEPEYPALQAYDRIWDPARDGGQSLFDVDGTQPWAWALYSRGCANQ